MSEASGKSSVGHEAEYRVPATAQVDVRSQNQQDFIAGLPPELRRLWENPRELIQDSDEEFFRISKPDALSEELAQLQKEFYTELITIARNCIRPRQDDVYTRWTIDRIIDYTRGIVNDPQMRKYALDSVLQRRELTNTDPLTKELSRSGLARRFDMEIKRLAALPDDRVMVLIEFDIDSFKKVNTLLGHAGADAIIIRLTEQIKSVIKELDCIGRRSGDELTIILNDVDPTALKSILDRIATVARSIKLEGAEQGNDQIHFLSITGSARMIAKGEPISYEEASVQADEGALYQKVDEPGKIIVWTTELKPDLSTHQKRHVWAEKLANNHIKRDTDSLYADLANYKGGPKYDATKRQIARMETIKAHLILNYIDQIEKKYGILRDQSLQDKEEKLAFAKFLAGVSMKAHFDNYKNEFERARTDEERDSLQKLLTQLHKTLNMMIKVEMRKLDDQYG